MRKAKLVITERLEYRREIIVNVPDQMEEREFERALNYAERNGKYLDDFVGALRDCGIELAEPYDDSLDSPFISEIECEEYDFLNEAGKSA